MCNLSLNISLWNFKYFLNPIPLQMLHGSAAFDEGPSANTTAFLQEREFRLHLSNPRPAMRNAGSFSAFLV